MPRLAYDKDLLYLNIAEYILVKNLQLVWLVARTPPKNKPDLKGLPKSTSSFITCRREFFAFFCFKVLLKMQQPSRLPVKRLITCQFIRGHLLQVTRCQLVITTGSSNRSLTINKHCCFCCERFSLWACGLDKGQIGKVNHKGMTDGHIGSKKNYENMCKTEECGPEEKLYTA